jgi:hypothetical protein
MGWRFYHSNASNYCVLTTMPAQNKRHMRSRSLRTRHASESKRTADTMSNEKKCLKHNAGAPNETGIIIHKGNSYIYTYVYIYICENINIYFYLCGVCVFFFKKKQYIYIYIHTFIK